MKSWKYPVIILLTIGISNTGSWIYLLALNLTVLDLTKSSAFAVAGLYIMQPTATLLTNIWSGSLIDRFNKRRILIAIDFIRALVICIIPFLDSLTAIYFIVLILGITNSIFIPTSMSYITMLIEPEQRKSFNSLRSLISSGAFLIGPALAGLIFLFGNPVTAIYINSIALFLSGLLTFLLPNLENSTIEKNSSNQLLFKVLKEDLHVVLTFSQKNFLVMKIYLTFSALVVMMTAIDSLEAAFSTTVLGLSEKEYGFLVSIAGAGIIIGSLITTVFSKKLSVELMISMGVVVVGVGYLIYSFSTTFLMAATGFFVLAFFLAFANTGIHTYYQENIPVEIMGRVSSIYSLVEAFFIILMTFSFGLATQFISLQLVIIIGAFMLLGISMYLLALNAITLKKKYLIRVKTEGKINGL